MFGIILEMFTYPFMVRALCMGVLVAVCSALLGVTLVLKRYSMIGDGATAMNAAPLAVAIPVVIAAAFLLLRLTENSKIKGDAAVALISTGALAIGVMVVSMTTGMNTDVYNYLFGSILSMSHGDVVLTGTVSAVIMVLFVFFYNRILGDGTECETLQYCDRCSHGTDHRSRYAHDGVAPDLKPCCISCSDQHADLHYFPLRHDLFGGRLDDLPGDRPCDLLSVRGADGSQHCALQHSGFHSFRSCAEGEGMLAMQ